ncbi:MAG: hypothetical protein BM485_07070 [Desulfobulbaceae bacterium DB1]|nr:MAG: hypothetical protein BM485_07070 [Desulfobulbaceae bacterium DB1]
MKTITKALKMLTVALSLVMLIGGAALTASAGNSEIKPFKGGLDTRTCTYEPVEAVWVCPK